MTKRENPCPYLYPYPYPYPAHLVSHAGQALREHMYPEGRVPVEKVVVARVRPGQHLQDGVKQFGAACQTCENPYPYPYPYPAHLRRHEVIGADVRPRVVEDSLEDGTGARPAREGVAHVQRVDLHPVVGGRSKLVDVRCLRVRSGRGCV
jgi:hypothetical protein